MTSLSVATSPGRRLLVVSSGFPDETGRWPVSVFAKQQVKALSPYFERIYVFAPFPYNNRITAKLVRLPPSRALADYAFDNVEVMFPNYFDTPLRWSHLRRGRKWFDLIAREVERRELRPDIVHAHFSYPSGHAAHLLSERLRRPFFITVHENQRWLEDEIEEADPNIVRAWESAQALFCVNSKRADLLRSYNERVFQVGNGYPDELFYPRDRSRARRALGWSPEGKILLSVADYVERKNLATLVRAVARIGDRDARLYLVGRDRGTEHELRRLIAELHLEERVFLLGPVANEALPDYYGAADLFVLPSESEGLPVSQIEAMACGLPAVATVNGGSEELITSPELGLLVGVPEDTAALAEAIDDALNRRWDPDRIVEHARRYSMSALASTLNGVFATFASAGIA